MITSWSSHGHLVVTSWSPHGHVMVTSWSHHGHLMVTSWSPHGHIMVTSWSHHGHLMVTSWSPHGHLMVTSLSPHGHLMVTSWMRVAGLCTHHPEFVVRPLILWSQNMARVDEDDLVSTKWTCCRETPALTTDRTLKPTGSTDMSGGV